jgi:hypothetical protein
LGAIRKSQNFKSISIFYYNNRSQDKSFGVKMGGRQGFNSLQEKASSPFHSVHTGAEIKLSSYPMNSGMMAAGT